MKTLWQKNTDQNSSAADNSWFYRFTAEEDRELDRKLIPYDILVNMAQAKMLLKVGVYSQPGFEKVNRALTELWEKWEKGAFTLGPDDEDVHSAVEKYVTEHAGADGARIHTGRSRNDQVLADMRLYMKDSIQQIVSLWSKIAEVLVQLGQDQKGVWFSGFTHTQPAMPHSADAWVAGYLDLLSDDMKALMEACDVIDQSPLGSAAGYGVPYIAVDRPYISELLGFSKVQEPVAAAQLSRGRHEMQLIDALSYGALTFNRMASDIVFFMHPSLGFVTLSDDQVSGSSIMPQKRNPDAWELIRAAYHEISASRVHLSGVVSNLISGYHRDLQVVKKSVMAVLEQSLKLSEAVYCSLSGLRFDEKQCQKSLTKEVFATHYANEQVARGVPFREAYREVANLIRSTGSRDKEHVGSETGLVPDTEAYTHTGAPGSGISEEVIRRVQAGKAWAEEKQKEKERIFHTFFS
ncbi:lyase family protein [Balneolaceae bacterium ANBcel3]|nr:lyase family protein [Balneolaceae bacterium ANBcel3]